MFGSETISLGRNVVLLILLIARLLIVIPKGLSTRNAHGLLMTALSMEN